MASAHKMVTVKNRAGIHARPAALIAQTANKFASEVLIEKNDSTVINAKSIMGVITMAAGYNTVLTVKAEGRGVHYGICFQKQTDGRKNPRTRIPCI